MALAVALVVLGLGFGLVERLWPSVRRTGRRRGLVTDVIYWFFTPLVSRTLAIAGVVIVAVAMAAMAGVPLDGPHIKAYVHRATWFGDLPLAAQVAMVVVLGDFIGYWAHRAFHRGRLWRFHAIHHASRDLDWLSATRLHPVNDILQRAVQAVPLFALGFDTTVLVAYVPALALYAIALHANVSWSFGPLRFVIASPRFHRWHHTSEAQGIDKNFAGLLPVWDLVFGTFHMPPGQVPVEFGVHDDVPDGIVGQLAWPFRRASLAGTMHSSRAR
jgi:sterol desaturase/sphingolipid hydroxylase (fatty acid hydroxylase superfamily)